MKKVLALLLCLSIGFLQAAKSPKKATKSVPADVAKNILTHVQKIHNKTVDKDASKKVEPKADAVEEEFDADTLDEMLNDNPDALETKKFDPTFMQRYLTQPMSRLGNSTYSALPESVQLALFAAYLYTEETYESFAEFIQERYQSFRGIEEDDEQDEEETPEEINEADSE